MIKPSNFGRYKKRRSRKFLKLLLTLRKLLEMEMLLVQVIRIAQNLFLQMESPPTDPATIWAMTSLSHQEAFHRCVYLW
ncbi:hypothetical protein Goarm_014402 [Gossypium armourianum]|uniref:Uncharacterized protein n=1 Tax=Gossypium armourianum TaxID=34283 RepID=A0A7J9J6U5_9ROSI|nr:hypothetical protein [Gossypium armourianum]